MATEPIQGGPYPVPADAPDGPSQLKGIVDWSAGRMNMRFASTAARDAAIPTPVAGMECAIGSGVSQVKYIYSGSAWVALWLPASQTDTGWVSLNPGLGWSSSALFVRRLNGVVYFSGEIWGGTVGGTILTLDAKFRPKARVATELRRAVSGAAVGKLNVGIDGTFEILESNSAAASPGFSMAPVNYLAADT